MAASTAPASFGTGGRLAVPRGARGVRLESGDEIVLGEARVRVKFGQEAGRR